MGTKRKEFKSFNIIVIGDTCTDKFVYGDSTKLAPEAPVPVFNPITETTNPGMAGNVARNTESLGANVFLVANKINPIKTRYVDDRSGHILLRVDENDKVERIDKKTLHQINRNQYINKRIDAIIISDYNKGFLEEDDIKYICDNNDNVFIDTKKIIGEWCLNSTFIKINHVEFKNTERTLTNLSIEDKLIITLSNKGCQYKDRIFPVEVVSVKDVSGAGDTFISGLVVEWTRSKNIEKSILFAQKCATIVVQKKGVATV